MNDKQADTLWVSSSLHSSVKRDQGIWDAVTPLKHAVRIHKARQSHLVLRLQRFIGAGVGYATATKLVNAFGTRVLSLMDSPDCVQLLSGVDGIGRTSAAKFKQLWDASRGI